MKKPQGMPVGMKVTRARYVTHEETLALWREGIYVEDCLPKVVAEPGEEVSPAEPYFRILAQYTVRPKRVLSRHETKTIDDYLRKQWGGPPAEDLPQPQDWQPGDICRPEDEE